MVLKLNFSPLVNHVKTFPSSKIYMLGLLAATDDQTFSMALPSKLRNYYDKVVTPATSMGPGASAGPRAHKLTGTAVQQMVQAYGTMNKFLTRFLEHVS